VVPRLGAVLDWALIGRGRAFRPDTDEHRVATFLAMVVVVMLAGLLDYSR